MKIGLSREIATEAMAAFRFARRSFILADLVYKAIAFSLLTPATVFFLHWVIGRTRTGLIADTDIARFFFTTWQGFLTLLLVCAILIAITAVECSCLMFIAYAASHTVRMNAKDALKFAATRSLAVLRMSGQMVLRILLIVLPFAVAGGMIYFCFLRSHDINYYLARKPPEFWIAAVFVGAMAVALVLLLLRTIAKWSLALPLILFENVNPRQALHASRTRTEGNHGLILFVLTCWALLALLLNSGLTILIEVFGRNVGPQFSGSLSILLLFIGVLAFVWIILGLVVAIFNVSLFSVLIVLLYLKIGAPNSASTASLVETDPLRPSRALLFGVVGAAILALIGIGMLAFMRTSKNQNVLVIAHRGASVDAPENTLTAFRLAAQERADLVELDVQESSDGIVVVNHDSDLMKVGRSPMKIWEHTFADLRTVDIGSYFDSKFLAERVPTLEEALVASKGSKVLVELKSYGHNERLQERVAKVVEESGMVDQCVFMSLDHSMARKMKELRPSWRVGVLAAKVIGDITNLNADFIAVEARLATRRLVKKAHAAHQDVYVWTVDDPAWMLRLMSNGVDGLITNKPALAREVIERRSQMSDAQRILVALLVRLGVSTDSLESENSLRP